MTFVEWIALIKLALSAPESIRKLIKLFSDTPAEKHAKLLTAMEAEADKLKSEGRPSWEN